MADHCLVTIGITCYNAEQTIERAVRSALNQDWPELEVIVVDDCSTDKSWKLLSELAELEGRLKIVQHQRNSGYPTALNNIIKMSSGDFIGIFDDDDDNVPGRVRAQIDRICKYEAERSASLVFCYSNRAVVKRGANSPDHIAEAIGRVPIEPSGPEVADFLLGIGKTPGKSWGGFGSCTLMARRSSFEAVGPFDPTFRRCAEWDMAIRAAQQGAHFISVNKPLITQYKTAGTDKAGGRPLVYSLRLREKHREYLAKKRLYRASRMFARARFWGDKDYKCLSRFFRALGFILSSANYTQSLLSHFTYRKREGASMNPRSK
jgi:glycosyltransferase involved in cell wall biosynthesis